MECIDIPGNLMLCEAGLNHEIISKIFKKFKVEGRKE
jgi:hypothetical protein